MNTTGRGGGHHRDPVPGEEPGPEVADQAGQVARDPIVIEHGGTLRATLANPYQLHGRRSFL
jgi:hypothetical protein